jgi:tRNA A22 N-methylase
MANNTNKILRDGYDRLKKTLEKIIKPKKEQAQPQLVLQPVRNRKYLRGNGHL